MSIPEVTTCFGGYDFTWKAEEIAIAVRRLDVHRDGRITADIAIKTTKKGYSPTLYPPSQINLAAPSTRKQLINHLSELHKNWNWQSMIDQLSVIVQEKARQGEPVQELWTHEDLPPLEYLLEPVIIKGVPNIIFGEKGVCKSTFSLICYATMLLDWLENPLGMIPKKSVKSLILDYEAPGYIAQRNAKYLQQGLQLPPFPLYHRRCFLPLADEIEQVQHHIQTIGAECLIIDSLGRAAGGDLKETTEANRFFTALDTLNITSLILAQTSKDTESKRKTVYGNAFFTYYARSIFELCRAEQTSSEDEVSAGLFHRWSNLTRLHKPIGFKISFNATHTFIAHEDISATELRERLSSTLRIFNLLKRGSLTATEIASELGWKPASVRPLLSKLKRQGKVVNLPEDKWGLASNDVS